MQAFGIQGTNNANPQGFGTVTCVRKKDGSAFITVTASPTFTPGTPFITGMTGSVTSSTAGSTIFDSRKSSRSFNNARFTTGAGGQIALLSKNIGNAAQTLVLRGRAFSKNGNHRFMTIDSKAGATTGNPLIPFTCLATPNREGATQTATAPDTRKALDDLRNFGSGVGNAITVLAAIIVWLLSFGNAPLPI
ncbi:MAG: hypothetical protein RBJ76_13305 [Stenomitos frigidus ULC029]